MSDDATTLSARRGSVLLEQGRFADAEKFFRESLAQDPTAPFVLYQLAVCEANLQRAKAALQTIDQAISFEPEASPFHAFRALILAELDQTKEALASADEALRLDPNSDYALVAQGSAYLRKKEWAKVEASARRALEINPENNTAANQLAHALRLQNRLDESASQSDYMLSEDPENPANHSTAGWVALQRGKREDAEKHFLEALRLEPDNEAARQGLKEAFRARSPLYRAYLNYCFFLQRFTAGKQWLVIIGLVVAIQVIPKFLPGPVGLVLIAIYFLFVLWVHVAASVGDLQLLFDRFARYALTAGEKIRAVVVGGGVVFGLIALLSGLLLKQPALFVLGLTGIGASFPFAYTFTNRSVQGRLLFGGVGLFVVATGTLNLLASLGFTQLNDAANSTASIAWLAVIGVTWLCNVPSLNRPR